MPYVPSEQGKLKRRQPLFSSPTVSFTHEVTVEITPKILADLFCEMGSDQQAEFFSLIAENVERWPQTWGSFAMQLEAISRDSHLSVDGRRVMRILGEYSSQPMGPEPKP